MSDEPFYKWLGIFLAVYVFGFCLTFGRIAATTPVPSSARDAVEYRALRGFMGAMWWPLYWSWVVFEP